MPQTISLLDQINLEKLQPSAKKSIQIDKQAFYYDQERFKSMIDEAWAAFNNNVPERRKRKSNVSSSSRANMLSTSEENGTDKRVITGFGNLLA